MCHKSIAISQDPSLYPYLDFDEDDNAYIFLNGMITLKVNSTTSDDGKINVYEEGAIQDLLRKSREYDEKHV